MIQLYHGSTVEIDHIDLLKSRPNKDFGEGSICLKIVSRLGEWVSSKHLQKVARL